MLLQHSIEHVSIVYTCYTYFVMHWSMSFIREYLVIVLMQSNDINRTYMIHLTNSRWSIRLYKHVLVTRLVKYMRHKCMCAVITSPCRHCSTQHSHNHTVAQAWSSNFVQQLFKSNNKCVITLHTNTSM